MGLPDRDLLIAGSLRDEDPDFGARFCGFVAELSDEADRPISREVFELLDGELVVYAG